MFSGRSFTATFNFNGTIPRSFTITGSLDTTVTIPIPFDTTIFLYGADLAKQMQLGMDPGNTLTLANWIVFVIGKMIGAFVVSEMIRRRENAGITDPYEDLPAQSSMV